MVAELGGNGSLGDLTNLHSEYCRIKLGHHLTLAKVAKVTATAAGGTAGVVACRILEGNLARLDLGKDLKSLFLAVNENVACVYGLLGYESFLVVLVVFLSLLVGNAYGGESLLCRKGNEEVFLYTVKLCLKNGVSLEKVSARVKKEKLVCDKLLENGTSALGIVVALTTLAKTLEEFVYVVFCDGHATYGC